MLERSRLTKAPIPAGAANFDKAKLERSEKDAWAIAFAQLEPLDALVRADVLPFPADQTRASYLSEIARAVLVQCDSGRSAAVKRALESLRILTLHTHKEMGSACLQGIVKYANRKLIVMLVQFCAEHAWIIIC
jgi:hypothetical protein